MMKWRDNELDRFHCEKGEEEKRMWHDMWSAIVICTGNGGRWGHTLHSTSSLHSLTIQISRKMEMGKWKGDTLSANGEIAWKGRCNSVSASAKGITVSACFLLNRKASCDFFTHFCTIAHLLQRRRMRLTTGSADLWKRFRNTLTDRPQGTKQSVEKKTTGRSSWFIIVLSRTVEIRKDRGKGRGEPHLRCYRMEIQWDRREWTRLFLYSGKIIVFSKKYAVGHITVLCFRLIKSLSVHVISFLKANFIRLQVADLFPIWVTWAKKVKKFGYRKERALCKFYLTIFRGLRLLKQHVDSEKMWQDSGNKDAAKN